MFPVCRGAHGLHLDVPVVIRAFLVTFGYNSRNWVMRSNFQKRPSCANKAPNRSERGDVQRLPLGSLRSTALCLERVQPVPQMSFSLCLVSSACSDWLEGNTVIFDCDNHVDIPGDRAHFWSCEGHAVATSHSDDLSWGPQKEFHRGFWGPLHCLEL